MRFGAMKLDAMTFCEMTFGAIRRL